MKDKYPTWKFSKRFKFFGLSALKSETSIDLFEKKFYLRPKSKDVLVYDQIIRNQEYRISKINKFPNVIVDAGAYIGLSSVYYANQYPGATILAIEPAFENFRLLVKNTIEYRNIIPIYAALSSTSGNKYLQAPEYGEWSYYIGENKTNYTVPCITLENIFSLLRIKTIDLLKMDIEGEEKAIFDSNPGTLENVDTLFIEVHNTAFPGAEASVYTATSKHRRLPNIGENQVYTKTLIKT